jgi:hypothetical protein
MRDWRFFMRRHGRSSDGARFSASSRLHFHFAQLRPRFGRRPHGTSELDRVHGTHTLATCGSDATKVEKILAYRQHLGYVLRISTKRTQIIGEKAPHLGFMGESFPKIGQVGRISRTLASNERSGAIIMADSLRF